MSPSPANVADDTATAEFDALIASWRRHLTAQRMSPATLSTYSTAVRQLAAFLANPFLNGVIVLGGSEFTVVGRTDDSPTV